MELGIIMSDEQKNDEEETTKADDRTSKHIMPMLDADCRRIKQCILFKNWSEASFKAFVDEKRIHLKEFKCVLIY